MIPCFESGASHLDLSLLPAVRHEGDTLPARRRRETHTRKTLIFIDHDKTST
jgi:hypothetical protein